MRSVEDYQLPYFCRDDEAATELYQGLMDLEKELGLPKGWAYLEMLLSGVQIFEKRESPSSK